MSWGKTRTNVFARALRAVAANPSLLMVSSAGNDAEEMWSSRLLPQSFDSANEITVASTSYFDFLSFFSNFGTHVEVAAPGERILSAFPGGTLYIDLIGRVSCGGIVNAPAALEALRVLLGAPVG